MRNETMTAIEKRQSARAARIQTRHPDPAKSMPRIERGVYDAFRAAILAAVPDEGSGLPFKDLAPLVAERLPAEIRSRIGSVGWYTATVKLDLEARGELERVPGERPQRLRRRG
jgi:hypothetical protein